MGSSFMVNGDNEIGLDNLKETLKDLDYNECKHQWMTKTSTGIY